MQAHFSFLLERQLRPGPASPSCLSLLSGTLAALPKITVDLLLQAYSNNLVDHHLILDLLPPLAQAYFLGHLPASLTPLQAAILCSLGLQQKDIPEVESALNLPGHQVKDLFNKVALHVLSDSATVVPALQWCFGDCAELDHALISDSCWGCAVYGVPGWRNSLALLVLHRGIGSLLTLFGTLLQP